MYTTALFRISLTIMRVFVFNVSKYSSCFRGLKLNDVSTFVFSTRERAESFAIAHLWNLLRPNVIKGVDREGYLEHYGVLEYFEATSKGGFVMKPECHTLSVLRDIIDCNVFYDGELDFNITEEIIDP